MWRDVQIAVVVPAYNEEQHIGLTLRSMPRYVDRIVVVDDGSADDTARAVARVDDPRVLLLRHPQNLGVGSALCSGYVRAFAEGAEIVAVMAGDGQMHPDDLADLLEPLVNDQADYVKGDRLSHPEVFERMPLHRFIGNHLLSLGTRFATGLPIRDSQCGYTALHRRAAEHVPWHALWRGYGYPNDLLGLLSNARARVSDVTVRPVYADEQSGIRLHHALLVIPFVLASISWRRLRQWLGLGSRSVLGSLPRTAARTRPHEAPLMLAIGDNGLPPSEP